MEQIWFPIARPVAQGTQTQGNKTQPHGPKNATPTKSSWRAPGQSCGAEGANFSLGCVFLPGCILYVISPYKFCMWVSHTNSCSICTGICYCVLYIHPVRCARLFLDAWLVDRSAAQHAHERARVRARGFEPPMSHALAPRAARAPDPRGTPMAQRRWPSAALILSHAVDF